MTSDKWTHPAIRSLTRNPTKSHLYSREPFFREAYEDFQVVLVAQTGASLLRHGLVVIKPEGLSLGVTSAVLDFYLANGFEVVAASPVTFTPVAWRALWTYQMTQASLDRLMVMDLMNAGEGIALLLAARDPSGLPGAVRLTELKGPAKLEDQAENCLRRVIRQPNRVFTLVHTTDEPADLVRDCGIFFGPSARRALARAMLANRPTEGSLQQIARIRLADRRPRRIFDVDASRRRLQRAIDGRLAMLAVASPEFAALSKANECLSSERPLRLRSFLATLSDTDVEVDPWDVAVVVSGIIAYDVPEGSKLIDNLGPVAWVSGEQLIEHGPAI